MNKGRKTRHTSSPSDIVRWLPRDAAPTPMYAVYIQPLPTAPPLCSHLPTAEKFCIALRDVRNLNIGFAPGIRSALRNPANAPWDVGEPGIASSTVCAPTRRWSGGWRVEYGRQWVRVRVRRTIGLVVEQEWCGSRVCSCPQHASLIARQPRRHHRVGRAQIRGVRGIAHSIPRPRKGKEGKKAKKGEGDQHGTKAKSQWWGDK
jgi:hypothetical protein